MRDPLPDLLVRWHPSGGLVYAADIEIALGLCESVPDIHELQTVLVHLVGIGAVINPQQACARVSEQMRALALESPND